MSTFTIQLDGDRVAAVRCGKIRLKRLRPFFKPWKRSSVDNTERVGYIVNVTPTGDGRQEYFLCRAEGEAKWLTTDEKKYLLPKEKWAILEEDGFTEMIKKAIEEYENKQ